MDNVDNRTQTPPPRVEAIPYTPRLNMDNVDNTDNVRKRTTAPPVWCFARPACLYLQQNRESESLNAARIWTTWTTWTIWTTWTPTAAALRLYHTSRRNKPPLI